MIAVLANQDGRWSAMIVKDDWLKFNTASAAEGSEADMREHFANLSNVVRKGTLRKLIEFAEKEGIA